MESAKRQIKVLVRSRTLLLAGLMVFLLAVSPGFGTPLFFYQTDRLHFTSVFIGQLGLVAAACGLLSTALYHRVCGQMTLRSLLALSVVIHALGTLTYLFYRGEMAAVLITGLGGISGTLAMLPIYDLAFRATPRGCEGMGYSVMMAIWNLTNAISDVSGSRLFERLHHNFTLMVWINAITTAVVLVALPILPRALLDSRDGDGTAEGLRAEAAG